MPELMQRPQEFLVTRPGGSGLQMMGAGPAGGGAALAGVSVLDTIQPSRLAMQAAGPSDVVVTDIVVAHTPDMQAELFRRSRQPGGGATISPNRLLRVPPRGPQLADAAPVLRGSAAVTVRLRVQNAAGEPLPNVLVKAYGENPAQATSGPDGVVALTFFTGTLVVDALYVLPSSDYWERWLLNPALADGATITLQPLASWRGAQFDPANPYYTWAQRLLGFDAVDLAALTGAGVKVAVADSGCDTTHPLARRFRVGVNYADRAAPGAWNTDSIGHGTWCGTIIAGDDGAGRRGYAPQAEMHTLKLFPGGAFDALQRALVYATDNGIDVISLSLGSNAVDPGTQIRLRDALAAGVAVFVAAGNTYGGVQFPASEPGVFAVAAVGQEGTYPPDSYHARTETQQTRPDAAGARGLFAPDFTAAGPAIQACAPGVAVVSGAPGGGYAAEDGTSMACPQMAGLAALALAHHPALRGQPRSAARTQQLYQLLAGACRPTGMASGFEGAGMPNMAGLFAATRVEVPAEAPAQASFNAAQMLAGVLAGAPGGFGAANGAPWLPPSGQTAARPAWP